MDLRFARRFRENFTKTKFCADSSEHFRQRHLRERTKRPKKFDEILGENFKVVDWQEANRPLFAALSLERKVALAIISLIIFIAALNITTTLALLVNERRLDIAVLRTCGAQTRRLDFDFFV